MAKQKKPLSQRVFDRYVDGLSNEEMDKWRLKLVKADEELLPELAETLTHGGMMMTHHPLCVGMIISRAYSNFSYLVNKHLLEKAEQDEDWYQWVFIHETPYQVDALMKITKRITDDKKYWELMASVYTESENLRQYQKELPKLLMSKRPKRESMMSAYERKKLKSLPNKIKIYRGFAHRNKKGWSWTIDRKKAEWFAQRFAMLDGSPKVITATVKKSDVIAYFSRRDEKEIVCDPKSVTELNVEKLEKAEVNQL